MNRLSNIAFTNLLNLLRLWIKFVKLNHAVPSSRHYKDLTLQRKGMDIFARTAMLPDWLWLILKIPSVHFSVGMSDEEAWLLLHHLGFAIPAYAKDWPL